MVDYKTADGFAATCSPAPPPTADAAALSSLGTGHVPRRLGGDMAHECVARIDRSGTDVVAKMKSWAPSNLTLEV